jgi:hypothetical protein
MSNYKELLEAIQPNSGDEAFVNNVIRKSREKQKQGSPFKPLYVLTALIMVIGIAGAGMGALWYGGYFSAPENTEWYDYTEDDPDESGEYEQFIVMEWIPIGEDDPDESGEYEQPAVVHDIPNITAETELIYADSEMIIFTLTVTSDEPIENIFVHGRPDGTSTRHILPFQFSLAHIIEQTENSVTYSFTAFNGNGTEVKEDYEYTIVFQETNLNSQVHFLNVTWEARASLFTGKIDNENLVIFNPDFTLEDGRALTEIKINPYYVWLTFDMREIYNISTAQAGCVEPVQLITHSGRILESSSHMFRGNTWVSYGLEPGGFSVHDIAAVVYQGEEIPLHNRVNLRDN